MEQKLFNDDDDDEKTIQDKQTRSHIAHWPRYTWKTCSLVDKWNKQARYNQIEPTQTIYKDWIKSLPTLKLKTQVHIAEWTLLGKDSDATDKDQKDRCWYSGDQQLPKKSNVIERQRHAQVPLGKMLTGRWDTHNLKSKQWTTTT